MNELEKAQRQLDLIKSAIAIVEALAEEDRKVTHVKHIDTYYREALDRLELKMMGDQAHLLRVKAIGR